MDRKPVSDSELAALGKFQGAIDRNSNFRQQAFDHNLGRNVRVVKLLGYLVLLRQKGAPLSGIVDCVAASRQNFSSGKSMTHMGLPTGPMEAAHFLPGQIQLGGKPIWQFATSPLTRGHIEFLFAEVEHLPSAFNQADTAAEAKGQSGGLCSALVNACSTLLRQPLHFSGSITGQALLQLIQPAYEQWHRGAMGGLQQATVRKGEKPGVPPLVGDRFEGYTMESIAARSTASSTLQNRDDALRILHYYLEDQQQRSWNWVVAICPGAMREVQMNFNG